MKKEFIPYKLALALKELGFDKECVAYYNGYNKLDHLMPERVFVLHDYNGENTTSAPTFSQAFRFFREKYGLHYRITYYDPIKAQELNHADYQGGIYASAASWFDGSLYIPHNSYWKLENNPYDTYEEAELECLKKLIEIVKKK
jgi:hypothetical protein